MNAATAAHEMKVGYRPADEPASTQPWRLSCPCGWTFKAWYVEQAKRAFAEHVVAAQPYPHAPACDHCRAARLCNVCGRDVTRSTRCTNGRCLECHAKACTGGGEPNVHGYGTRDQWERAAAAFRVTCIDCGASSRELCEQGRCRTSCCSTAVCR